MPRKIKRGTVREVDGKIFYKYHKPSKNGEWWMTREQWDKARMAHIEYSKKKYTHIGIWYHRARNYGITRDQFYAMLSKQSGCCALCADHLGNLHSRIHVDHDHNTGRVRGLLCVRCNNGLGNFRDNADVLRKAADYVTHQNTNLVLPSVGK